MAAGRRRDVSDGRPRVTPGQVLLAIGLVFAVGFALGYVLGRTA